MHTEGHIGKPNRETTTAANTWNQLESEPWTPLNNTGLDVDVDPAGTCARTPLSSYLWAYTSELDVDPTGTCARTPLRRTATSWCTILNYTILYYTILYYTIIYYTIIYYTILLLLLLLYYSCSAKLCGHGDATLAGVRPIFKLRIAKFGIWVKHILKRRRWIFWAHRLII